MATDTAASTVTLDDIRAARERIRDVIYHSPCPYSMTLSRLCGADVYCKFEHLQMTGSFKERGARNKLLLLGEAEKRKGVIAASAGNHALALAWHGRDLRIPVTVVMPKWAPLIKVANCRSFGANVIFCGESYDDARKHAKELGEQKGLTYIPGFDDRDIIAGAGTLGLEILEDVPDVDVVIIPVGGGGLIAGVGRAIKALRPETKIIGVEPANAPTLDASLKAGRVTKIDTKPTLADGLAVAEVGKLCFEISREVIDQLLLVDEAQIAQAVLRLLELEKTIVEGGGAVPLAAAMNPDVVLNNKKVVLLLSGGNIDVTVISKIIERGLAADGRLCRITCRVSDRPGSLARLATILAATGASVKEVEHDREFGPADVGLVNIRCILETRDFQHVREISDVLKREGIENEVR
ncbi:MAG: threonine dehydratase [Phycisphaerales bacterium]|jgi:threonine dehydratase|nr:threonine dehydratase [Phycisphaerales bacterium]